MPQTRRDFMAASGAALGQSGGPTAVPRRPNLIFFMPDTLRADALGCYGHPLVRTPNFDRLASQGVRFVQCQAQNSFCAPSRCSLMTGWPLHVRGHRSLYHLLQPDEPNLLRYLKQSGYDVFWYGKNDLLTPGSFPDSVTAWAAGAGRARIQNPWPQEDRRYYSFLYGEGGDRRDYGDYACVQSGIRVLERSSGNPFCLFLPLSFPHPPYTAPQGFHRMYDPKDVPPRRPAGLPQKPGFHEAIRRTRRLTQLTDKDWRQIQAVYYGMVSYSDWLLGELLEAVERTGHAGDTAIFAFSDHGDWTGDYGLVEKWSSALDDVLLRVPLVARVPGGTQGHVVKEITELYDVMPTCLELAGIQAGHKHFARSLMPQIRGGSGDPGRAAFAEAGYDRDEPWCFEPADNPVFRAATNIYHPKVMLPFEHPETITRATMIRTLDHKLVMRPDGQSEFYDLKNDPQELHNSFGEASYQQRQADLQMRLLQWYIRTADVAPPRRDPRGFPGASKATNP